MLCLKKFVFLCLAYCLTQATQTATTSTTTIKEATPSPNKETSSTFIENLDEVEVNSTLEDDEDEDVKTNLYESLFTSFVDASLNETIAKLKTSIMHEMDIKLKEVNKRMEMNRELTVATHIKTHENLKAVSSTLNIATKERMDQMSQHLEEVSSTVSESMSKVRESVDLHISLNDFSPNIRSINGRINDIEKQRLEQFKYIENELIENREAISRIEAKVYSRK